MENIFSLFLYLISFSYNKNHLKTQQQKSSCKNSVPAGIRTRDLRHRLENQKGDFSQTRSAFSTGSYWPILLIFNSKHRKTLNFLVYNFEEDRSKIATVRVPHSKTYKMAAMTSSDQHFQNLRKVSSQNLVKIMWSKFHQNRPNSVQIKGCDRHTHTHTYTRTDRARSGLKYSVIWNDWI